MDYKKTNAPSTTVTRDMMELCADTGNVYETVSIIGKRANQISVEIKNDLSKKLAEFASYNDNLEEVFENREQIEISRNKEKCVCPPAGWHTGNSVICVPSGEMTHSLYCFSQKEEV